MKRLVLFAVVVLSACTSSSPQSATPKVKVQIPEPDFEIRQLVGPPELNYEEGPIEVKFELDIGNRAKEPITLERVEIWTENPEGGAYTLIRRSYYFRKPIPPGQAAAVQFWAKAIGYGRSMRENEPVTVRGVLYYSTANGYYNQVFQKEVGQYAGQND